MMNFKNSPEFQRDFKRLAKKFKTLNKDLAEFKKVLNVSPQGIGKHFNVITRQNYVCIVKARFFCQCLKKKDLRIIYAFCEKPLPFIEFLELYFKGVKENEDKNRIKKYLKYVPAA